MVRSLTCLLLKRLKTCLAMSLLEPLCLYRMHLKEAWLTTMMTQKAIITSRFVLRAETGNLTMSRTRRRVALRPSTVDRFGSSAGH